MADLKLLEELGELIEDLTTSGSSSLEPELMKNVKKICKSSDVYVKHAYHILMTQLKKNHAEVRLSAFQIISELFQRSHVFRELLIDNFQIFLELTAQTNFKQPLPPPTNIAKTLMESAWRTVEAWHEKFGSHYKNLDLGFKHLKRVKHAELTNLRATSIAEQQRTEERERRRQDLLRKKLARVETQMSETVPDIARCLTERENCFKLLLPHPNEYEIHSTVADEDISKTEFRGSIEKKITDGETSKKISVETSTPVTNFQPTKFTRENSQGADNEGDYVEKGRIGCSSQISHGVQVDSRKNERENHNQTGKSDTQNHQPTEDIDIDETQGILTRHGLGTRSYQISIDLDSTMQLTVHESDDNSVILDQLRESNKEVAHRYLPLINKWLSVLTKCDGMQLKIQEIIDMKRALEASRDKFHELHIIPLEKEKSLAGSSAATQSSSYVITTGSSDEDSSDEFEDVPEKEALEVFTPQGKEVEPAASSSTNNFLLSKDNPIHTSDGIKSGLLMDCRQQSSALADPTSRERALLEMRRRLLPGPSATITSWNQCTKPCQPSTSTSDNVRQKLLEQAPVVPFDVDLHFWEDPNAGARRLIKSNVGNNYWASKDDQELELEGESGGHQRRTMIFAGKFEPVKWACRAPLARGKLCPRRDRVKCPFHGKIVARDEMGCPVDLENAATEGASTHEVMGRQPDWREVQLDIEAATGLDLGGGKGKKRAARTPKEGDKLTQKEKYARLTNIKKNQHTPRARLEAKVLDPKAMKRVAKDISNITSKKHQEKFGNQFNYALRK